jgi:O-antigen/teichoic acid export membrane protein
MSSIAMPASGSASPARPKETVRRSFLLVSAGFSVYAAAQWAIVAVLAKLGSLELVGQYAFAVALTTPVLMLAQMNLRSVLATDVHGAHRFEDYRDLRFGLMGVSCLVVAVMAVQQPASINRFLVILLVGVIQAGEWIADIFYGRMQQLEQTGRMAPSLVARGVFGAGALAIALWLGQSLVAALVWVLVARTAVYFAYDSTIGMRGMEEERFEPRTLRDRMASQRAILGQALPLGIVLMLGALVTNTPRYFIANELGERQLGLFSAIFSLAAAGNLVVTSLGQAATPRLARLNLEGDSNGFRSLSFKIAALGAALGLAGLAGAAVIGERVVALVYGREYADQKLLLLTAVGATGLGFIASLLGYAITAARRFNEQMPLQAAGLAGTAVAAFLLVPRLGLVGGAIAVGAGALVQVLAEAWILRDVLAVMRREDAR